VVEKEVSTFSYKIVAVDTIYRRKGDYITRAGINHVFVEEENCNYDSDTDQGYGVDETGEPKFIAVTLCKKYKNGFNIGDANEDPEYGLSHPCSFEEIDQHFCKNKNKKTCKACLTLLAKRKD
jgi:hypothetical protein